mgnify:FL=1
MDEFEHELDLLRALGLKESNLRREYEEKVARLREEPAQLRAEGLDEESIARELHRRRELGRIYKEAAPPLFREYIYAATAARYGDPLGPGFEQLRRTKSCAQIIESAAHPIKNLDDRQWYKARKHDGPH